MKPIDYRNESWARVQGRVIGIRLDVWKAFQRLGPGTTREIAQKSKIDILTLRPRVTELYQLGFIELVEQSPDADLTEGIYLAIEWQEVERRFFARRRESLGFQPELQLK